MTRTLLAALLAGLTAAPAAGAKLTVRVTDADSGAVIPARLAIRAADGSYPGDRLGLSANAWPNIEAHAVYVPGEQTFDLPAGEATVTAARGPQYSTATKSVALRADAPATVELKLRRVVDLRKLGWVGGDAHLHMIHGEMLRPTSFADVATTCLAAGLREAKVATREAVGPQPKVEWRDGPVVDATRGARTPKSR